MNETIDFHHKAQLVKAEIVNEPSENSDDRYLILVPEEWQTDLGEEIEFTSKDGKWQYSKRIELNYPATGDSILQAFQDYKSESPFH